MVGLLTAGADFRESVAVWSRSGRVLVDASDLAVDGGHRRLQSAAGRDEVAARHLTQYLERRISMSDMPPSASTVKVPLRACNGPSSPTNPAGTATTRRSQMRWASSS